MDIYSLMTLAHMKKYGTTVEQIAGVTAKNSFHASMNARAQFQTPMSVAEVLAAREIVYPLTLPMCSPIGDGAAAIVVVSERKAKQLGLSKPVRVLSSALVSGFDEEADDLSVGELAATQAYESAGVGPEDLDVIELHDASAPSEIITYEYLGICAKGQGGKLIEDGTTRLGGRLPVNVSGGLLRKGHPIGASGAAQIVELTEQLRAAPSAPGSECAHCPGAQWRRHDWYRCGGYCGQYSAPGGLSMSKRDPLILANLIRNWCELEPDLQILTFVEIGARVNSWSIPAATSSCGTTANAWRPG